MARKVTEEAVEFFLDPAKGEKIFNNTAVYWAEFRRVLSLHGNRIAMIEDGNLYIRTAGWDTVTTRERLNGLPGVDVYRRKGVLHLNGKPWDNHEDWTLVGKVDEL